MNSPDVSSLPPLREVISAHGLNAKKSLGQNFLLDLNLTDKIVRQAGDLGGVHVLEVGPGPGGLTRSLVASECARVTAVEMDHRAIEALQGLVDIADGKLDVMEGDALATDLKAISDAPRGIVANLPYNIATPLLLKWLKELRQDQESYAFMCLMFQKEVAQRICAIPSTKAYGRLAVISQWLCDVKAVVELRPSAFTPPPKVRSSVVLFKPKKLDADAPPFEAVERVTAQAFQKRRKMVRSSLQNYAEFFDSVGIDSQARAENLTVEDYVNLAKS